MNRLTKEDFTFDFTKIQKLPSKIFACRIKT